MIYGIFHKGSGLGNQLHRYVATRVLALDKGYDFGMVAPELFKGSSFMNLDMGKQNSHPYIIEVNSGKVILTDTNEAKNANWLPVWNEWNKNVYDPDFNFIEDNTIIDGNFEDLKYFEHRLPEIKEWLKTEPWHIPDDVCVIGFRGGEYYTVPELGLPVQWFYEAMKKIVREVNPKMKFEVHTDDENLARLWFPDLNIIHDVGLNWRAMRYAKCAIIANSSFYVLPRLLNGGLTVAPKYWNRYNTRKWDYPQNYYKQFIYI